MCSACIRVYTGRPDSNDKAIRLLYILIIAIYPEWEKQQLARTTLGASLTDNDLVFRTLEDQLISAEYYYSCLDQVRETHRY